MLKCVPYESRCTMIHIARGISVYQYVITAIEY